jgi:AraC family transcriptional regulator
MPGAIAKALSQFTRGTILRWRRVPGLVLAEVEYEPGQRLHRDAHPNARFVLVLSGSLSEVRGGELTPATSSTLLFQRANDALSYIVSSSGARCLIVDMDAAWLARARDHAPLLTHSTMFRRGLLVHLAHRLYGEFRQRDDVSRLAIGSLALGVLAEASRRAATAAPQPAPLWLQVAIALVNERFHEPLPLSSVAKSAGVHPVHLARTFRRIYNTTFATYVRQVRIDFARRELIGSASLSEIACAAGFCDQSHFSRCFKQYTGLTPAEYRASVR